MIKIGGLTPLTTTDYPGCLSAVVFCQGCAWRCEYCHNAHLLDPGVPGRIEWDDVLNFLDRRKGLLDAVVFSGGEPLLQKNLPGALMKVREMGFRTGLHTSGAYPERLEAAISLVDWVGMDVKAPFDMYETVTHVPGSGRKAKKSVALILESGIDCEFRTTAYRLANEDILRIEGELERLGAGHYKVQAYRSLSRMED